MVLLLRRRGRKRSLREGTRDETPLCLFCSFSNESFGEELVEGTAFMHRSRSAAF